MSDWKPNPYTVALVLAPLALGYLFGLETAARLATAAFHQREIYGVLQMEWAGTVKQLRWVAVGVFTTSAVGAVAFDVTGE